MLNGVADSRESSSLSEKNFIIMPIPDIETISLHFWFTWAPVVMFNHALIDRKVKLVDLFKTMERLNNSYAIYMLGRGLEGFL